MSEIPTFNWSTLEKLLPLCIEFVEKHQAHEDIDIHDAAIRVGQAFGISDLDKYAKGSFEHVLMDGFNCAFDDENAKALAKVFAKSCKPVMNAVAKYAQGETDPVKFVNSLNKILGNNVDGIQTILQKELGIPDWAAEHISEVFGPYTVSIYCFAGTYKIYRQAALDAELARLHRIEIEQYCNESIALLKAQRAEMEARVDTYMLDRLIPFGEGIAAMDQAILDDDDQGFISANLELWEVFGRKAAYTTPSEFDELMLSDETFKL